MKCIRCGKVLKDPHSLEIGIDPICRLLLKTEAAYDQALNPELSQFTWGIDKDIIWIKDLAEGVEKKSILTDIKQIFDEIGLEVKKLNKYKIMYKDSMGIWDGIVLINGVIGIFSLNEKDFNQAKVKLVNDEPGHIVWVYYYTIN